MRHENADTGRHITMQRMEKPSVASGASQANAASTGIDRATKAAATDFDLWPPPPSTERAVMSRMDTSTPSGGEHSMLRQSHGGKKAQPKWSSPDRDMTTFE